MYHHTQPGWRVAAAIAALAIAAPLSAQQSPAAAPAPARTASDSVTPTHHSRFGRFGRVFERAASTASEVGAKAGISKETAARLAVTAATGGAAAALMQARMQGAGSAASLATRGLTAGASAHHSPSAAPSSASSNALGQQAMRAMTDLGQISARAQQHDPSAVRALQALSAAMARPDGEFVALQQRASAGDPTAAQQMLIREDAIARAALGGTAP